MIGAAYIRLLRLLASSLLILNTAHGVRGRAGAHLLELIVLVRGTGAVDVLFVLDDLRIDGLEFGLQGGVAGSSTEAVGAAARLGEVVVVVLELGQSATAPGALRQHDSREMKARFRSKDGAGYQDGVTGRHTNCLSHHLAS